MAKNNKKATTIRGATPVEDDKAINFFFYEESIDLDDNGNIIEVEEVVDVEIDDLLFAIVIIDPDIRIGPITLCKCRGILNKIRRYTNKVFSSAKINVLKKTGKAILK